MDPVSAFGVFTGALQVVQIIGQTIAGLSALRGKYQNADITIRSMIGELSTIKSAINQLHDWAAYNSEVNSSHREYEEGLGVAIDGCRAVMDVISDKVTELVNTGNGQGSSVTLDFHSRVRVLWNEEIMSDLQQRLHSQVRALNLLLQACQCRSSTEQLELLRKVESRQIIKRVADDTITLRSVIYSTTSSQIDSHSVDSQPSSSVGNTEFEFDDALLATSAYQRPNIQLPIQTRTYVEINQRSSRGSMLSISNEGYPSHNLIPSHSPSQNYLYPHRASPLSPSEHTVPDNLRSKSVTFGTQPVQHDPGIRRWVSTGGGANLTNTGGSRREKFFSALKRLNTSSKRNLTPSSSPNPVTSPSFGTTRGRRGIESEFTTSIDLTTQIGKSAPYIVKAAQLGERDIVERLILSGHDIEECHLHSRRNALMVAAHCGKEDIVDLLIQNNAQLNRTDASGSTALHLAASRGHSGVVSLLLMEAVNPEAETRLGRTALWVSANNGHLGTTQLLLENHAKASARADNQMTALHVAARRGDVEIASLLINYGVDVDARDASMMTALHHACEGGHSNVIELLLSNKASIDVAGSERKTPLIYAAAAGKLLIVQLLARRKAKLKGMDEEGMTALHWAAINGHVEIVDFLAGQSRNSLILTDHQGKTPLHLAAMNSQFAVVEYLMRKNCSLETKCASGFNPLHYACRADSVEIVRLLLTSGASVESQTDVTQQRPIHIAAAACSVRLIRLLCEKNASLEARDATGDRALCVASRNGHVAAVQTLLDFGSPLHMRFSIRSHEDSPLCLAAKGGHLPVVSLLMSRGASVLSKDEIGWSPVRYAAYHGHPDILEALLAAEPSAINLDPGFSPDSFGVTLGTFGFAADTSISSETKRRILELLNSSQIRAVETDEIVPSRQTPAPPEAHTQRTNQPHSTSSNPLQWMTPVATADVTSGESGAISGSNDNFQPSELPGSLEQGLPSSRSTTPTHMHRNEQAPQSGNIEDSQASEALPQLRPPVHEHLDTLDSDSDSGSGPSSPLIVFPPARLATSLVSPYNRQLDETSRGSLVSGLPGLSATSETQEQ